MTRWRVELLGSATDLAVLRRAFADGPARVHAWGRRIVLEADELERLPDSNAVRAVAKRLLDSINGAMRVQDPGYQNVRIGAIYRIDVDGTSRTASVFASDTIAVRVRELPAAVVGSVAAPPPSDAPRRRAEVASRDEDAREALEIWANERHDWWNLYKVHEIIESRGGISLPAVRQAVSKRELERFTRTANHPEAAGRRARHARLEKVPPKVPMPLEEAEAVIARLLAAWLDALAEEPPTPGDV